MRHDKNSTHPTPHSTIKNQTVWPPQKKPSLLPTILDTPTPVLEKDRTGMNLWQRPEEPTT